MVVGNVGGGAEWQVDRELQLGKWWLEVVGRQSAKETKAGQQPES